MIFSRAFSMPSADTFSVKPIGEFVQRYLKDSHSSIDPFARNREWFTHTNDLNPDTKAKYHMDAEEFCKTIHGYGFTPNLGIFDPPYSPRQISECYKSIGLKVGMEETQNARLYKRVRDAMDILIPVGGTVLSFGWQSAGMGLKRGYEILEIMLVAHGGGHNDTICMAERKLSKPADLFT